jgi:hypothetical protein
LLKKGHRKRIGKLVVLEDLSKTWERNEKRDRALFLEKLFKENSAAGNNGNTGNTGNVGNMPNNGSDKSGSSTPHRSVSPFSGATTPPKHSPRLVPLDFTPSLPKCI